MRCCHCKNRLPLLKFTCDCGLVWCRDCVYDRDDEARELIAHYDTCDYCMHGVEVLDCFWHDIEYLYFDTEKGFVGVMYEREYEESIS